MYYPDTYIKKRNSFFKFKGTKEESRNEKKQVRKKLYVRWSFRKGIFVDTIVLRAVFTGIQETETATVVSTAVIMAATTIREKDRDVCHIEDK